MSTNKSKYDCLKKCIVKGCFRKGAFIPTHVFATDHKTRMSDHDKSERHLVKKCDLEALIPCCFQGCTYSTSILSDLTIHELSHEKEIKLGCDLKAPKLCSYEGCTYSTSDSSNLKKHELTHEKEAKLGRHSFVEEVIKDNLYLYFLIFNYLLLRCLQRLWK